MDCACDTKVLSKIIALFKFVHYCHGNRCRKDQTAKLVDFIMFKAIKFIVYFGKMITKQRNKPGIANL